MIIMMIAEYDFDWANLFQDYFKFVKQIIRPDIFMSQRNVTPPGDTIGTTIVRS